LLLREQSHPVITRINAELNASHSYISIEWNTPEDFDFEVVLSSSPSNPETVVLRDLANKFSLGVQVDTIPVQWQTIEVVQVVDAAFKYSKRLYSQPTSPGLADKLTVTMQEVVRASDGRSYERVSSANLIHGGKMSVRHSTTKHYGMKVENGSDYDLFLYILYFGGQDLSIRECVRESDTDHSRQLILPRARVYRQRWASKHYRTFDCTS
jgi:hypothetical protein